MSKSRSRRFAQARTVVALLIVCLLAPAAGSAAGDWYPSRITAFNVDITVGNDNVCRVVNTIDMEFAPDSYSHGLYMTLDLEPHVFFEQDGEYYSRDYRARVSDLEVSGGPWERETEDGELLIRVGDPDVLVDGQTCRYVIAYDYDAGDDGFPDFDMFYYGIIGNGWNQTIDNISFAIHMPSEFDPEQVGFSVGGYGAEGYDPARLHFSVDGSDITGTYAGQLDAYEGIWIRLELPAGYFVNARTGSGASPALLWTSVGVAAAIAVLWLIFRPKEEPVVTVEFGPPPGLNSADVGCVADGKGDVRDVMSLLIWWASEGYIRIVQIAPDADGKDKGLLFVRLRDLPVDADSYQHVLFDKIFEAGDRIAAKDLRYKMSGTVQEAVRRLTKKFSSSPDRLFTKASKVLTLVCGAAVIAVPAVLAAVWAYEASFGEVVLGVITGVFTLIFSIFALVAYCTVAYSWPTRKKSARVGGAILSVIPMAIVAFAVAVGAVLLYGPPGLLILSYIPAWLLVPFFRTRTVRGCKWYGRILGLKRFIERAEKDRLEALVQENPSYYYDILPYAYVLGVTDVWAKQFEDLALEEPSWYVGSDVGTFSAVYLTSSLARSLERAQSDLTAVRSSGGSGGGGGFSGGGFSGGGFGGSGGGSW